MTGDLSWEPRRCYIIRGAFAADAQAAQTKMDEASFAVYTARPMTAHIGILDEAVTSSIEVAKEGVEYSWPCSGAGVCHSR